MTIEQLLKACSSGNMPRVRIETPVRHSTAHTGIVTTIKQSADCEGHTGCAVRFDGMKYDSWFHAKTGTDKRTRYMSELSLA